jgi:hypothetical protein
MIEGKRNGTKETPQIDGDTVTKSRKKNRFVTMHIIEDDCLVGVVACGVLEGHPYNEGSEHH